MTLNNICNYNTLNNSILTTDASPFNTAVGVTGVAANPSGLFNVAIGYQALNALTFAGSCTAVGYQALALNATGQNNTAVGSSALSSSTAGEGNTAVGSAALFSNTEASNNTAVGLNTLAFNRMGDSNTAVGSGALLSSITGSNNTVVGFNALSSNLVDGHSAFGVRALALNTTGGSNTAIGFEALYSNTEGFNNLAVGYSALYANISGSFNTAIGYGAGLAYAESQSNNILIGANVLGVATDSAVIRIGATATITQCYVGGIYGTISTQTDNAPVIIDSHGQIGTLGPLVDGQLIIGATGANPVVATLTPGAGITIANSAGGIMIASTGGGLAWSNVTVGATATANMGYIGVSGSVSMGLPTISSLGDLVAIALNGGDQIEFIQDAGQSIRFGPVVTTTGVNGRVTSTSEGDLITLLCTTPNTSWMVMSSQGNWTVV